MECSLTRYGPLAELGRIPFSNFTLLFGENESGKTLLVDALIKMLFQRKSDIAAFYGVERVDETPEGYLILEVAGEEIKLPEAGDVTSVTGISAEDCRSVFVVRNSDLQVPEEGAFYTSVTDRLVGIHSVAIERIRKNLQDIGKLTNPTSDAQLSDREDFGKVKTAVKRARKLLDQIGELEQQAQEEGLEDLEARALSLEKQIREIDQRLERMELAGKREAYERARQALSDLGDALETIDSLAVFNDQDLEAWQDSHREIVRLEGELRGLENSAEELRKQLAETQDAHEKAQAEYQRHRDRRAAVDDLQTEIYIYRRKHEQAATQADLVNALGRSALVSSAVFAVAVFGLFVGKFGFLQFVAIGSGLIAAALFGWWLYASRLRASLSGDFERIRLDAATYGVSADDIETLLADLENYNDEFEAKRQETERLAQRVISTKDRLDEMISALQSKRDEVEKHQGMIRDLSDTSGVSDLESYEAEVRKRANAEKDRDILAARLKEILGLAKVPEDEPFERMQERVQGLAEFADKATDQAFDEEEFESLGHSRKELEATFDEVEEQLSNFREQLKAVSAEANSILSPEEALLCETLVDLVGIGARLEAFVDQIDRRKDLSIETIALFERIAEGEAEKVSELFGEKSPVSQRFKAITDGVYEEVGFDMSSSNLWARKADGKTLRAEQLSGGTYDQLYLAVRLALAERLLQSGQGFFILDDPFLTSDTNRLRKQMELLHDLVKAGWQILYFSVKDEVHALLKDDIKKNRVSFHGLSSIHA